MIAELTEFMLGFYGTLHCVELQKLEELLTNRRIFCPANGGQLSC